MDLVVGFIRRVVEIWLDSGVVIPALLTGYYFSDRPFGRFLSVSFLVAVVDHILIVLLYRFSKALPGEKLSSLLIERFPERIVAFMIASLVVYAVVYLLKKFIK